MNTLHITQTLIFQFHYVFFISLVYTHAHAEYFCNISVDRKSSGVVTPPRKLLPNWTKVSLRTTHDWRIKFKRANEKNLCDLH